MAVSVLEQGNEPQAVLIAGPTASGKSALAMALAERLTGIVLNADSMQVYGDLRVLTARPTVAEAARVPHGLYGHVDAETDYSVGRWLADATSALAAAREQGLVPIFVGGTGLYFRALTQGLAEIPPVPEAVRGEVRGMAQGLDSLALHARLADMDPQTAARLQPNDRQRVLRALEVITASGRSLSDWQRDAPTPVLDASRCVCLVLEMDRAVLRQRIDARFEAMMADGALEEVRALAARRLDPARTVLKAHGAPALTRHLVGEMTLDAAIAEGQGDTRRYAKRQETFFRHQMADWPRATPDDALEALLGLIKTPAP
ncbi:tRNA (adenosine(37)-N6)-dimethylallyltransferase MiaA [Xanthobacter autotrophicus]|jgi:tRNA dimethylallyltransferase|uniref:tRNA (adenosine(37)-N6)-dimethylallyltransferase MiaA n=1 Tax=Xanthobacter autotrophicus TaxID=280 RepID=UPI00372B1C69